MSFFGLFSSDKSLSEKAIARLTKQATSQFAQPEMRREAMDKLVADGSPAAISGLLKRFTINSNGEIADEEEKQFLEKVLVELGEVSITPIREYIAKEKNLTYPINSLFQLQPNEEVLTFLLDVLDSYGPEDHRSGELKLQIIYQIEEHDDGKYLPRLVPYLQDHDDDVRLAVLKVFDEARYKGYITKETAQAIAAQLAPQVLEEEFSPRVQLQVAALLCKAEWALPEGEQTELIPMLQERYYLDKKRFVRELAPQARTDNDHCANCHCH